MVQTALRVGRSSLEWILANGKAPPVLPTSEKLRPVESLNDARAQLEEFLSILLVEEQRVADLLGKMAGFAFPAHDLSLMLRLPIVASETIRESPCP